jgi:hypothetical protein
MAQSCTGGQQSYELKEGRILDGRLVDQWAGLGQWTEGRQNLGKEKDRILDKKDREK